MKKYSKILLLSTWLLGMAIPSWGQSPSTEGRDFWVTFLRAADDNPTELKLTISALEACDVTIENTTTGYNTRLRVNANSAVELPMNRTDCYSSSNEVATYTALHVTSTKDISLFAGNYRDKSFDATNVLPTPSLLDDYLIQTYPPSDHENKPQGSHFAIIAVEDGETTVDYTLTAKTSGGKTGTQTAKLNKGQVWYVWTGLNEGDAADLSGTTVKARDGKKIAVFQGCPHTNIPYSVRDRDHIVSQAMPTAYWGTEFGITASRKHRRDIVAVMAINDGTQVYINNEDGDKILVHTFDFTKDKKRYWTFEIGEELAYCADNAGQSPSHGKLPEPLVVDSSCYLTTSCPAGVHLFMVSNRYDNLTEKVNSDTLVSDPAMLWISPIEQVIKEINFATYHTQQAKFHFMNILTTTADVANMQWNGNSIAQHFHPLSGNSDYSFARIQIQEGSHHLKGSVGFLAHVYGYGERESYAYSCGSSTIQRSVTFNGSPLMIDSVYDGKFCVNEDIEMKLNIGNNDYQYIEWNYGDGVTYIPPISATNDEKKSTHHTYTAPGWYDLLVSTVYVNSCTGTTHNEDMRFTFRVVRPDTVMIGATHDCIGVDSTLNGRKLTAAEVADLLANGKNDTLWDKRVNCYDTVQIAYVNYGMETEEMMDTIHGRDEAYGYNGKHYTTSQDVVDTLTNAANCRHFRRYYVHIITCLDFNVPNNPSAQHVCPGNSLTLTYTKLKGDVGKVRFIVPNKINEELAIDPKALAGPLVLPIQNLSPGIYKGQLLVEDLNCDPKTIYIDFSVYYPNTIFAVKYNNVLAVYNKANNGGYEFVGYQWYCNDQPIIGATQSVYHADGKFKTGDLYYVELTDANGVTLPSCPQTIGVMPDFEPQPSAAPAQKLIRDNRLVIQKDGQIFDLYGQRVQ